MHVEKQKAIDGVLRHRAFGTKPKHVARNHFNHLLWRYMQDGIMDFAAKHRCEVRDIEVECDSDMRDTVLAWGMKPAAGAKAYDLADVIAWSNVHGRATYTAEQSTRARSWTSATKYGDMRRDLLKWCPEPTFTPEQQNRPKASTIWIIQALMPRATHTV